MGQVKFVVLEKFAICTCVTILHSCSNFALVLHDNAPVFRQSEACIVTTDTLYASPAIEFWEYLLSGFLWKFLLSYGLIAFFYFQEETG